MLLHTQIESSHRFRNVLLNSTDFDVKFMLNNLFSKKLKQYRVNIINGKNLLHTGLFTNCFF